MNDSAAAAVIGGWSESAELLQSHPAAAAAALQSVG